MVENWLCSTWNPANFSQLFQNRKIKYFQAPKFKYLPESAGKILLFFLRVPWPMLLVLDT